VSARSKARKQTLDLLYESDIRSSDLVVLLASRDVEEEGPDARPIREYTKLLIEGIHTHKRKIDEFTASIKTSNVGSTYLKLAEYVRWFKSKTRFEKMSNLYRNKIKLNKSKELQICDCRKERTTNKKP